MEFAHPNFLLHVNLAYEPDDTYFDQQYYLHNTGQTLLTGEIPLADADMDVPEAWDITLGNSSIVTAVIDAGITSNHPDLPNSRQVRLPGANLSFGLTNPGAPNPNPNHPDSLGPLSEHGDACAGIIAATQDNNEGISGIAPLTKIMPVKFDNVWSNTTVFANCFIFADLNGANILSGSFNVGTNGAIIPVIENAIDQVIANNKVIVMAAGNTKNRAFAGPGINNSDSLVLYPGTSANDALICVGASDHRNRSASYSPESSHIDVVAPSSYTVSQTITQFQSGGHLNVWTMDPQDSLGMNPHSAINGLQAGTLPNSGTNYLDYSSRFGGTSAATPMVAGVAALVLSVNSCLSNNQVKDIITNSADKIGGLSNANYNWTSTRPGHSKEFGYGKVNAHKAVIAAQAMQSATLDLMIKDVPNDFGVEPDTVASMLYVSEDIWLRNQPNGRSTHYGEAPEYDPTNPVYIYVRVRNKSCTDATANDSVSIYWAKASTALAWPTPWNGSINNPLMGDSLTTLSVGNLAAGKDTILEIPWHIPNPTNYNNITNDIWHFCLLARIKSTIDTMSYPETNILWQNVKNNNNIAWKNVTVVDNNKIGLTNNELEHGVGAAVGFGNFTGDSKNVKLNFKNPTNFYGEPVTTAAEITVKMDAISLQKWEAGGHSMSGLDYLGEGIFKVVNEEASIANMNFEPFETSTLYIGFNFLTEEADEKVVFHYYVEQLNSENEIIGGEEYFIHRDVRPVFYADAGFNQLINQGQSVSLQAQAINEPASYNWYDENGHLFFSGTDTTFIPAVGQRYTLEIIAHKDGFKDYDETEIILNENFIENYFPNPVGAQQSLTLNINTQENKQVLILISNITNTSNSIYSVPYNQNTYSIPMLGFQTGNYTVSLMVNGIITDSKTLTIN